MAGRVGLTPHRAIVAALCTAALALGAGAAGRIYHGPAFAALMTCTAAGATGVSLALLRRPQWMVPPVSVATLIGYAGLVLWWLDPAPDAVVRAVRDGPRLLTSLVPLEVRPETVLLPIVVVWVAGLIGAESALRAGWPAAALVPPVVVYTAALALAGPDGGVQPWRAVAFVALSAGLLATGVPRASRLPATGVPRASRLLAACVPAVAVALAVAAVALTVPHRPADPRASADPPLADPLDENPLARVSGWTQDPDRPLFDVELSEPARLTLAALSDFDGVTWRIGASYRPAGRWLPEPTPPAGGTRVDARITIRELGGRLVPAVDTPWQVRGIPIAFDPGSGSLLGEDAPAPGTTYTVTSVVPRHGAGPATRGVPGGPEVARFLRVGAPAPVDVATLARSVAAGEVNPYRKAQKLERFLAEHYTYDTRAPGGHAYPNLRFFLLGSQRGTSEQFAAAYAVLGRLMGLPTRVVVGFTSRSGRGTVRGADALAWPEVLFAGIGWVPFGPLPEPGAVARPLGAYRPSPPPPSAAPPSASAAAPVTTPIASSLPPPLAAAEPGGSGSVLWPACAVLLVAAQLAVVAARRRQSRRRLRGGDPSDRVAGAWLELLDALRLAGRPAPAGLTVTEVAGWAAHPASTVPPLDEFAEFVNRMGFGPASLSDRDATVAGEQARAHIRAQRRAASPWRRVCWHVHPGPLWWRHVARGQSSRHGSTRR